MKTIVSVKHGEWRFEWENRAGDIRLAGDIDGPFDLKEGAEFKRNDFVEKRIAKYPYEYIEVGG